MQKHCTVGAEVCVIKAKKMKAYCTKCLIELTGDLVEFTGKVDADMPSGECYIKKGYYQVCDGTWGYEDEKGLMVINPADLINTIDHRLRISGCCGMSGFDGPNKLCINGHEIATEHADCWQTWQTVFKKNAVIIK